MIDVEYIKKTFPDIATYIPVTFQLVIGALLLAIPFAILFSLVLNKKVPVLTQLVQVYISFIRGTPLILQIYILYNRGPEILQGIVKKMGLGWNVYELNTIWYGYFILSLTATVSLTDAFRTAFAAVDKGQIEASYSVGLTPFQAYRRIIFPQAIAVAIPIICNTVVSVIKGSSLAFAMAVTEITGRAKILGSSTMKYLEAYLEIFVIYLILIVLIEFLFRTLERKITAYKTVL